MTASDSEATILSVYKLAVEMADRVSARRGLANGFYVTVQAALFAFVASAAGDGGLTEFWPVVLVAIAGVAVSVAWWMTLRSYRDLSTAKWTVIGDIERDHLAIEPFNAEWSLLKKVDEPESWHKRYAELGMVERFVPWIFAVLYVVLAGWIII